MKLCCVLSGRVSLHCFSPIVWVFGLVLFLAFSALFSLALAPAVYSATQSSKVACVWHSLAVGAEWYQVQRESGERGGGGEREREGERILKFLSGK